MAQQNAFNQALTRIGFNVDTTERMIDEGFDTLETLSELEESDIDNMMKGPRSQRSRQCYLPVLTDQTFESDAFLGCQTPKDWATA
jgi:hypothetical protein